MKVLVILKGQLTCSLLQDTFSMATGHLPTDILLSFHLSIPVPSRRPNFGLQDRAQLSLHIHSFCPSNSGTLARVNGEGFVYLAAPAPFFAAPVAPIGSCCFIYKKWIKYERVLKL